MDLLKRIIFIGICTTILQVVLFGVLYDGIDYLYVTLTNADSIRDISWGLKIKYSLIFYIILTAILNLSVSVFGHKKSSLIGAAILLIIFDIFILTSFGYRPYRTVLLFALTNGLLILTYYASSYLENN